MTGPPALALAALASLTVACFLLPGCFLLPVAFFLLSAACFLLPAACFLLPTALLSHYVHTLMWKGLSAGGAAAAHSFAQNPLLPSASSLNILTPSYVFFSLARTHLFWDFLSEECVGQEEDPRLPVLEI